MREAVIVSFARTPIGLAFKGSLNNIKSPTLAAHAISAAVSRAGIDPGEVEDLVMGSVLTAGTAAMNLGWLAALKPVREGGTVTAGNASQLSDGAAAMVLMERRAAERRNLPILGAFRMMTVAGCAP